jgi:Raf kinase inhibitor-like YbhB/YbcL family protein
MQSLIYGLFSAATLAGCATEPAAERTNTPPVFTLSAPDFGSNASLSLRHAGNLSSNPNCVGSNVSPALQWSNAPAGTKSFAFLVHDQEGRNGLGVAHWVAYNIPVSVRAFADNEISKPSLQFTGGKSTLNLPTYMGPCPPTHTGQHHYVFTVIATGLEPGALPDGLSHQELLDRLNGHAKGGSSLVLRYGRP